MAMHNDFLSHHSNLEEDTTKSLASLLHLQEEYLIDSGLLQTLPSADQAELKKIKNTDSQPELATEVKEIVNELSSIAAMIVSASQRNDVVNITKLEHYQQFLFMKFSLVMAFDNIQKITTVHQRLNTLDKALTYKNRAIIQFVQFHNPIEFLPLLKLSPVAKDEKRERHAYRLRRGIEHHNFNVGQLEEDISTKLYQLGNQAAIVERLMSPPFLAEKLHPKARSDFFQEKIVNLRRYISLLDQHNVELNELIKQADLLKAAALEFNLELECQQQRHQQALEIIKEIVVRSIDEALLNFFNPQETALLQLEALLIPIVNFSVEELQSNDRNAENLQKICRKVKPYYEIIRQFLINNMLRKEEGLIRINFYFKKIIESSKLLPQLVNFKGYLIDLYLKEQDGFFLPTIKNPPDSEFLHEKTHRLGKLAVKIDREILHYEKEVIKCEKELYILKREKIIGSLFKNLKEKHASTTHVIHTELFAKFSDEVKQTLYETFGDLPVSTDNEQAANIFNTIFQNYCVLSRDLTACYEYHQHLSKQSDYRQAAQAQPYVSLADLVRRVSLAHKLKITRDFIAIIKDEEKPSQAILLEKKHKLAEPNTRLILTARRHSAEKRLLDILSLGVLPMLRWIGLWKVPTSQQFARKLAGKRLPSNRR